MTHARSACEADQGNKHKHDMQHATCMTRVRARGQVDITTSFGLAAVAAKLQKVFQQWSCFFFPSPLSALFFAPCLLCFSPSFLSSSLRCRVLSLLLLSIFLQQYRHRRARWMDKLRSVGAGRRRSAVGLRRPPRRPPTMVCRLSRAARIGLANSVQTAGGGSRRGAALPSTWLAW